MILSLILLQLPAVQTKIIKTVNNSLEEKLGNKISVKSVDINFFNNVDLNGIYVEDQAQDTLALIEELNVSVSLLGLLKNRLHVKNIQLKNAHIHLKKDADSGNFNFQFILDAFAPADTIAQNTSAKPLDLDIDALSVENTHFILDDPATGMFFDAQLKQSNISIDVFDLTEGEIKIGEISLNEADVYYDYTIDPDKVSTALTFPGLPIVLNIDKIDIRNSKLGLKEENGKLTKGTLAYDDIRLIDLNLTAENMRLDSVHLNGHISKLSAKDHSGFELQNLQTNFALNNQKIDISEFKLLTAKSEINNTSKLSFSDFSDLQKIEKLNINTAFQNTKISISDISYFTSISSQDFFSNINDSEKIILDGQLSGNVRDLTFKDITARIPGVINTKINGDAQNLLSMENLALDVNLQELKTSAKKLSKLLPKGTLPAELDSFGEVDLVGEFKGSLKELQVKNVDLNTSVKSSAKLSGTINNILSPENLILDVNIQKLSTHLDDVKGLIKEELPSALKDVGAISYVGKFRGGLEDFDLTGTLTTDIGDADTDIDIKFNSDYTDATYIGNISLKEFDLGSVLGSEDFGTVNLKVKANGSGFDFNTMKNEINAEFSNLTYKDVLYENFNFNGQIAEKKINGDFNIDNPNAIAQFKGILDLSNEQPIMDFQLNVDTLELKPMNITTQDIGFSGNTQVVGQGKSIDEFYGSIKIEKLHLRQDSLNYQSDSLYISSVFNAQAEKELSIITDGIEAMLKGDFTVSQLPIYITKVVDEYIPVAWISEDSIKVGSTLENPQIFTANLNVTDAKLIQLFVPQIEELEELQLVARVNSDTDSLSINGGIRSFIFDGMSTTDIRLSTNALDNKIKNQISFNNLTGIANILLPKTTIDATLQKDSLLLGLDVESDTLGNILNLSAALSKIDDLYEINFRDKLQLDSATWNIASDNHIKFKQNYLDIESLNISKYDQRLDIQSESNGTKGQSPIAINIKNFDIHELSNLLNVDNDVIYGNANGKIRLADIFTSINYSGDLLIEDIIIEKEEIGDFKIVAAKRDASQIIDIDVSLLGSDNDFIGQGYVDLDSKDIKFKSDFDNLELAVLDPFLAGIISASKGTFGGNISIGGKLDAPIINGSIKTNQLSTLIDFSKSRYEINNQNILINDSQIGFKGVTLSDKNGKTAIVSGKIDHTRFTEFYYDLSIDTKGFQFLNTTAIDNPLFYGTLFLDATAKITGPLNLPDLEVDAKSLTGSKFHLSPFIESDVISNDDYIIFTNKEFEDLDSTTINLYELKNDLPLNLTLNLDLDKETEFQFIIDPVSGDHLSCFGNSNLQIEISPSGQINVYGTYYVNSGKYNFSYGKLIKREFDLVPGGRVTFQGDPLLAGFDVNATYSTKATPFALLTDSGSLSDNEIAETKARTTVQILLKLAGSISNLDLNFDLAFPDNDFGANSAVSRRLTEIRNDQEEMYNQVFGLLLLNSFIASNSSSLDINTGSDIALSSVSSLIENRLNNLADKFIKGVDVSVNVDSYSSDYLSEGQNTSVTELGVGLSKSLFNDRLTLQALGNVDVDNRSNAAGFSGIAGDFIIEYKLNERGTYLLTAFRKSDYNILQEENANKNGVSISFKKSLNLRRVKTKKDGQ